MSRCRCVLPLLIAVLCLSACGSAPRRASGISGSAIAISQNPALSWVKSDPNARILVKATTGPQKGTVLARAKADARGSFRVSLPPGNYVVYGRDQSARATSVAVDAGHFTQVQVVTDTVPDL